MVFIHPEIEGYDTHDDRNREKGNLFQEVSPSCFLSIQFPPGKIIPEEKGDGKDHYSGFGEGGGEEYEYGKDELPELAAFHVMGIKSQSPEVKKGRKKIAPCGYP
jgi:hypothetical protein